MMRTIALLLIACAASCAQQPVNCPVPLSERQLTDLLKGQVPEKRLHVIVKRCGVAFVLNDSAKSRLRAAGASADLLEEIRTYGPKTAWPQQLQQQREIVAGTKKVNPKDGLTYVWIPPGRFTMGCSPGDGECDADEKPAHRVTITKGFWIGQTEVTQEAFQRAMGSNPSHFQGTSLPVDTVSWNEAQRYCEAVGMRLPTEAEWEYAARAGSTGARYGDGAIAWHAGNSGGQTHEVAQKQPNTWGLYDMLGNVWEWVADWYADYAAGSQSNPHGPASGTYRALRGGSWVDAPWRARASNRGTFVLENRGGGVGGRCAVERIP